VFDGSFAAVLPLGVANIVVWLLLIISTTIFLHMINQRFGKEFKQAKRKLIVFLSLFSLSFGLRGAWDIAAGIATNFASNITDIQNSMIVFSMYMLCEWLPLFVIFMYHKNDFTKDLRPTKVKKGVDRARLEEWNQIVSPGRVPRQTTSDTNNQDESFNASQYSRPLISGGNHNRNRSSQTEDNFERRNPDNSRRRDSTPDVYELVGESS